MIVCAAAIYQNGSLKALTKLFGTEGKGYVDHATMVARMLVRSVTGISVLDCRKIGSSADDSATFCRCSTHLNILRSSQKR